MLLAARRSPADEHDDPVAASHELGFAWVAVLLTERPADERALLMCHGGLVQRAMQWPYGPRSQFARRAGREAVEPTCVTQREEDGRPVRERALASGEGHRRSLRGIRGTGQGRTVLAEE